MAAVRGSFESKLVDVSSEETLKAAKQLLKNDRLACAYRDQSGQIQATFRDKISYAQTQVKTGDTPEASCSCPSQPAPGKLCEHALAVIMHCGRFKMGNLPPIDDDQAKFSGLKYENLSTLASRGALPAQAQLRIETETAFPHVPSKWENSILTVKLLMPDREYLGNLNNLRQLYFEKSLSVSLKLDHFSLQDQQVIRFLSINGEAENSKILLNSEQTCELFHSLIHFERFYRDGRRVIVHSGNAEPVILRKEVCDGVVISPGLRLNQAVIAINHAKVITGRTGCWVGYQGEYFFVAATLDIGWLRNFFRTGTQPMPGKISEQMLFQGNFPVPLVDVDEFNCHTGECELALDGGFDREGTFTLKVRFVYEHESFRPNGGRLARTDDKFWLRDHQFEATFLQELEMFGFRREGDHFLLNDADALGVFFDQLLPQWLNQHPSMLQSASLAKLCRGGAGIPELSLRCRVRQRLDESYLIEYDLRSNQRRYSFADFLSASRSGRSYEFVNGLTLVKLTDEFRHFLTAAENVMRKPDEEQHTFELADCSVNYWLHIAEDMPGAVPTEFGRATHDFPDAPPGPDYEFKGTLRSYQKEGVDYLKRMCDSHFNVILADEMGLGKTIQALALLASRKHRNDPPALVICPASLVENWERECAIFVPEFRCMTLAGTGREDALGHLDEYDLLITSYSTSRRDAEVLQKRKFSFIILDEAQHIKNPGTINAQNCKSLRAMHKLVLTGTPLENSTDDLWSIFDFLHPGMLGTFNSFHHYYANIHENKRLQDDLNARVSPFIMRRTKDKVCAELPPKQEVTLFCAMDHAQRKLYEEILRDGRAQLARFQAGDSRANVEIFTTLLRLRQVCCAPALLPDELRGKVVVSAKLELLYELIQENIDSGHKMLLFSQFTSLLSLVQDYLKERGIAYEYLDGATRNRQQRVDHFNADPSIKLFLLSLKAGGTGLNLTSADTVILFDPWWNPAVELQAADRTHRIGQTRPVTSVKLLVKDSIEEKILQLQGKKQDIFDSVIDNPHANAEKLSIEELRFLLE